MRNTTNNESSRAFKWFHATGMTGSAMIISAIIASYFSVYMTDTMLIPTAAASIIMLLASLWDAVNDPMMGMLADRTNTRWGRYRPYFLFAPLLLMFFSTMLWMNPDFSMGGKIAWVLIMYIGWGMTVTMYTMPHSAVLPACVKSNQERNKILSMGAGVMSIMFFIGNTFTVPMKAGFENALGVKNGYIPMMLLFSAISCISFWGLFATAKEKYIEPKSDRKAGQDLKTVLKHTELIPYIIVWLMASMGYGLMFSSSVYYIQYYIGRPDQIPVYMGIVSIGAMLSMIIGMPLALKVFRSGHRALVGTQIIAAVIYVLLFLFGRISLPLLYALTFLATAVSSMQNALVNILVNDAIDYIKLKEGFYANGIIASIKGFAQKAGTTVVSSGILGVLAAAGYVANQAQSESALLAINFLRFGAPVCTAIIMLICLRFNPVEKVTAEIEEMKRNETGEV